MSIRTGHEARRCALTHGDETAVLLDEAGVSWAWREAYDYNSVQFGLTNNRSQTTERLLFDDVLVGLVPQ